MIYANSLVIIYHILLLYRILYMSKVIHHIITVVVGIIVYTIAYAYSMLFFAKCLENGVSSYADMFRLIDLMVSPIIATYLTLFTIKKNSTK